jgi:hypothetical protein
VSSSSRNDARELQHVSYTLSASKKLLLALPWREEEPPAAAGASDSAKTPLDLLRCMPAVDAAGASAAAGLAAVTAVMPGGKGAKVNGAAQAALSC